jgi:ATP-dependent Clp protease ATP-binding subunit ClpA
MLARVEKKISTQGLTVSVADDAKEFLVEKGFDPHYGARPLQRSIQRMLEDPLAEDILSKKVSAGTTIFVSVDKTAGKLVFSTTPPQEAVSPR